MIWQGRKIANKNCNQQGNDTAGSRRIFPKINIFRVYLALWSEHSRRQTEYTSLIFRYENSHDALRASSLDSALSCLILCRLVFWRGFSKGFPNFFRVFLLCQGFLCFFNVFFSVLLLNLGGLARFSGEETCVSESRFVRSEFGSEVSLLL